MSNNPSTATPSIIDTLRVTFTKLKTGEWGLRGPNLAEGERVTVEKRDGSTQTKTVGRVLWTCPNGSGVTVATVAPDSSPGSSPRVAARRGTPASGTPASAGPSRGTPRAKVHCEDCGLDVAPGTACYETMGIH